MDARQDEDMTEVSSTISEATKYAQKKGLTCGAEPCRGDQALHEKDAINLEKQQKEVELLKRRRLEERADRIEELRVRVHNGTYKIDSLTVAQRIQDSALMPIIMGKENGKLPRLPRLSRPRRA